MIEFQIGTGFLEFRHASLCFLKYAFCVDSLRLQHSLFWHLCAMGDLKIAPDCRTLLPSSGERVVQSMSANPQAVNIGEWRCCFVPSFMDTQGIYGIASRKC